VKNYLLVGLLYIVVTAAVLGIVASIGNVIFN